MARVINVKPRVSVSDATRMICERAVTERPELFETHVGKPLTHLTPAQRIQVKNVGVHNAAVPAWQFVSRSEHVIPRTFQVFHFDRTAIGKAFGLTHAFSYGDTLENYFKDKLKELGSQAKHVECRSRALMNGNVFLFVFERAPKPPLRQRIKEEIQGGRQDSGFDVAHEFLRQLEESEESETRRKLR